MVFTVFIDSMDFMVFVVAMALSADDDDKSSSDSDGDTHEPTIARNKRPARDTKNATMNKKPRHKVS